ncbi:hypothetical protein T492DRAFT_158532 [Pavlovales sp. CCMP2436]|nr:hypothetical protein T492DRAFT_158532 [Pavlovales sp. CCMP2436]
MSSDTAVAQEIASDAAGASVATVAPDFPLVDIAPFLAPDGSPLAAQRGATALAWDSAMREWGFARVTGHQIDPDLVARLRADVLNFFDLSLEEKRRYSDPSGRYGPEGYTAVGIESVGRTSTAAGTTGGALPDLVENLVLRGGPIETAEELGERSRFPPSLQRLTGEYWKQLERTLGALHAMTALALGEDVALFDGAYRGTQANALRMAHYPAMPADKPVLSGQMRYGAHTDYQGYTLLMQDPLVGGLEVFRPPNGTYPGGWSAVPPGGLVVNAGDLVELWVNGRWRSAMHRVGNSALAKRRLSLAFFTGPRGDARIEPIVREGEEARFEAVIAGEHLARKLAVSNVGNL